MSTAIDARPGRKRIALVSFDAAGRESAVVLESQDQTVTGQGRIGQKEPICWTTVPARVVAPA
jgi:hypothetical protein